MAVQRSRIASRPTDSAMVFVPRNVCRSTSVHCSGTIIDVRLSAMLVSATLSTTPIEMNTAAQPARGRSGA